MKKLYLLFLWHMHQPEYKNPLTDTYEMPWTFLHCIKDYYEMPWHVSRFENIKATFNLVPSLIKQILDYTDENVKDKFLLSLKKRPEDLTVNEKRYLIPFLFNSNPKTMIKPFPRYYQLFLKKEQFSGNVENLFSNQEILDLEVLFLLSWTGISLRKKSNLIKSLIEKSSDFTQEDKEKLLKELFSFLKEIIPFYKKLRESKKIEISTTPFYHPILPLLIDINSAKEATPEIVLPKVKASFKDHAEIHVDKAVYFFKEIFGEKPSGFWPAEGSISSDAVSLFSKKDIIWAASDEDVLFNSLGEREKRYIYKIYRYKDTFLFFRDKTLSDLIGFTYSNWDPKAAASDFINRLKDIYNDFSFPPMVSVILDGENAWEFYEKNGFEFFNNLYSSIEEEEWIETLTFSEILEKNISPIKLEKITAGSWIGGNFYTWVGHPEKNKGWELLSKTKEVFDKSLKDKKEQALDYMLTAEGSDWFWWYGDDHYTPYADKFDMLFRGNLQKVYQILNVEPPPEIFIPIKQKFSSPYVQTPNYYVFPIIDGEISNYFEWLNGGIINLTFDASAMDTSQVHLKKLYYGYDDENLYLGIEGSIKELLDRDYFLSIDFLGKEEHKIFLYLGNKKQVKNKCDEVEYLCKHICEVKIPFKCLPFNNSRKIEVSFGIYKDSKQIERIPFYNYITLDLSKRFDDEWFV